MNIFKFEKGILTAIKAYIQDNLPSIYENIEFLDYEPAPNELSSFYEGLKGAVCVYTRTTTFPEGSQNSNWNTTNAIEIDCYAFSKGAHRVIDGKRVEVTATEAANLQCQAITTACFLTVTNRHTLENSFNVVDSENKKLIIGEKYPTAIELFTQEDIENTQISQCIRKIKLNLKIEEQTIQLEPSVTLNGFNYGLESYKTEESYNNSQT